MLSVRTKKKDMTDDIRALNARLARLETTVANGFERLRGDLRALGAKGSFYEQHGGVRFKHALLDEARRYLVSGGRISRAEVDRLWDSVLSDGKVSSLERRTLVFIGDTFRLTPCAQARLRALLADTDATSPMASPN